MEEAVTPTLWDTIGTVITKIITLFGTVCSELMKNQLFQITLGIVVLSIVFGIVFMLVKKIKRRGK